MFNVLFKVALVSVLIGTSFAGGCDHHNKNESDRGGSTYSSD